MIRKLAQVRSASFLGRLVRLPLALLPGRLVLKVKSGVNKGYSWIVGASTHGCWLGTYETDKQIFLSRVVRPGMRVWDVGANAGFYTLAFARLAGIAGRIYAFEPLAENVNHLLAHLRMNRLGNVSVVQAALGRDTGLAGFEVAQSNSMGRLAPGVSGYLVATWTIDDFLDRHPEARPDVIKIDVEGAESDVLAGGARFLAQAAPTVVLSLHGSEQARLCAETLTGYGYALFFLDGTPAGAMGPWGDEMYALKHSGAKA